MPHRALWLTLLWTLFVLYPNPASSELWLQVNDLPAGQYRLKIYNAAAQPVNVQTLQHGGGALSEKILLRSYTTGMYTVEISGAAILFRSQFFVGNH